MHYFKKTLDENWISFITVTFYFGKISLILKKNRNKDLRPTAMVWGNEKKKGENVL